ncbi:FAD-dependent monooxygenase [Saccharothrix syringae]|uniref:2,4-dichlorophenol 6-monooxygenase n=1 Tax=Saccharothrix syringae TaxID=103733 RepID=A0A5Q0H066_SACSY|nr:FAD-dependent monooxygenase [Saccharothrix syringae]QFZ19617.1 2,4-dichlorophenol 6-monooxygenase [Saccharothrix syringae]
MPAPDNHVDVLVAGAGSVGLFTTLFLARRGVRVLAVDRNPAPPVHPRAMGIGPRTVELLREAGLADEVDAACVDMSGSNLQMFSARTLADADLPALAAAAPPRTADFDEVTPRVLRGTCPQSRLDGVLVDAARRHGATVLFGFELVSFVRTTGGVAAVVRDADGERVVRADYLVGADGVRSGVRTRLGIPTSGPGALGLPLVSVLFRADLDDLTRGHTFVVCDVTTPEAPGGLLPVDGAHEWIYHTRYDPARGRSFEDFTPDRCRELVRAAVGRDVAVEVVSVLPWQARGQVADRFRSGRVFLVGDAAHAIPPVGAFGLNTGAADAHNLAWKLALVLRGTADPALLDTYEAERLPVARTALEQSVLRLGDPSLHWARGPEGAAKRAAAGALNAPVVHLGYRYSSAAVVDPPAALPSTEDVALDLDGAPGSRVPHVWLKSDTGQVSTLDLLGPGFTLLAGADGAPWATAAAEVSAELGVPVDAPGIGTDLVDLDARWERTAGITASGAVLVRPDGFVGWRAASLPEDPRTALRRALGAILGRP